MDILRTTWRVRRFRTSDETREYLLRLLAANASVATDVDSWFEIVMDRFDTLAHILPRWQA